MIMIMTMIILIIMIMIICADALNCAVCLPRVFSFVSVQSQNGF